MPLPAGLSNAYIMDGNYVLSQEHVAIAQEIAHRYENLRLIWIPVSERSPIGLDNECFAIVDRHNRNIIRTFTELTVRTAIDWLWENDSQRVDTYEKFLKEKAEREKAARSVHDEENAYKLDVAAHVLASPLHTYKHDNTTYSDSGVIHNAR